MKAIGVNTTSTQTYINLQSQNFKNQGEFLQAIGRLINKYTILLMEKLMEELDRKRYEEGMKMRRSVLGDAWVDKATESRTEFTEEWQSFITRYAWGEVWTRPGIDRRTRSHMTLALMIALGRWEEFNLHVVAAFNNGLNEHDIKEIILHAACYCGVPAGNNAFAEASATLAKIGRTPKPIASGL